MFISKKKSKGLHASARENDGTHTYSSNDSVSMKEEKQLNSFEVFFLGIVPDIMMSNSGTRDREAQLVDRIEEAQIEGRLPMCGQEEERARINISLHGVKVTDLTGQEVLQRHPLHTIAQVVQYTDGGNTNNIVFKIGNVNKTAFSAYVFQCLHEEHAVNICNKVRQRFDEITGKNR